LKIRNESGARLPTGASLLLHDILISLRLRPSPQRVKNKLHNPAMAGTKKGNVDSDIIFNIMKKMYKRENFEKIILVSGDGDYKRLVDFLIEEKKFEKILFPNRQYRSSLYKKLTNNYFVYLDDVDIKEKFKRQKIDKKKRVP
jgi:uncharacterized LabA/DUF88 family protein